ncbi:MAG: hypothetical protein ACLS8R_11225 [Anaeromassilibacillus sp.]|jgi:hypothetical protein|uniref:Uncharacterized protein n=1 Tax=Bianquea renquensis TaxID=2763661 RepID=A0A926DTK1_9FIRM|nr:hypothetical protein [Bianquea renquensis]MBC8543487.1 hypothetical protein [Bianquea renquensis]
MREEHWVSIALTSHEQYLDLLKKLKGKTAYIVIVQINGEDDEDEIIANANTCMQLIEKRSVNKWLGTKTRGRRAVQFCYRKEDSFFRFLSTYPSFFFNRRDRWGCDEVEYTDFGTDDIAFLDDAQTPLFFTTTHEGYANIVSSIL